METTIMGYVGDLFLGTLKIRCRIIVGIQKGTIILTTTHKPCLHAVGQRPEPLKDERLCGRVFSTIPI